MRYLVLNHQIIQVIKDFLGTLQGKARYNDIASGSACAINDLCQPTADIISVSVADPFPDICPGPDDPVGTYVPFAEAVKDRIDTLVVGVGKINTREAAEEVLSRGKIDLIGIGRQLIADPHWVIKVSEGRNDEMPRSISIFPHRQIRLCSFVCARRGLPACEKGGRGPGWAMDSFPPEDVSHVPGC